MVNVMADLKNDDDDKTASQYGWRWTTTYYAECCLLFAGLLFCSRKCMTIPIEGGSARCPLLCVVFIVVAAVVFFVFFAYRR